MVSRLLRKHIHSQLYFDVYFDLYNGLYKPYRRPRNETIYLSRHSNHPPVIIEQPLKTITKRISVLSSRKDIFDKAAPLFNTAMRSANYAKNITYNKVTQNME